MMRHRAHKQLAPGDFVPEVRLRWLDGGEQSLAALSADGPVLVTFFKISCPVCQLALPFLQRLHGVQRIIGISQNDAEDTREFNRSFGLTFPMLLDPEDDFPASNAFGITYVPTTFVIEQGGRIGQVMEGWNRQEMDALGALREGDNVPAWKAG
jgi:peroxiredoxin